jgi:putative endonuclease
MTELLSREAPSARWHLSFPRRREPRPEYFNSMNQYFVYILASKRNGTLYIGITNDIDRRVYEHRNGIIEGFTKEYHVHMLVHVEEYSEVNDAIVREKRLKKWNRQWKIDLIEKTNPDWKDLSNPPADGPGFPPSRE